LANKLKTTIAITEIISFITFTSEEILPEAPTEIEVEIEVLLPRQRVTTYFDRINRIHKKQKPDNLKVHPSRALKLSCESCSSCLKLLFSRETGLDTWPLRQLIQVIFANALQPGKLVVYPGGRNQIVSPGGAQQSKERFTAARVLLFWTGATRSVQGRYLLTDDRIIRSFVNVDLRPVGIVFRHVGVREDCFHRTFRHAGIAINASVGINVEAVRQFVKCFDRAHCRTVGIFAVNA
jgi:hypothetical protein